MVEVWPENHLAFNLFCQMRTQWRMSMSGPTGLDHNVLLRRLDRLNLSQEEYDQTDEDVRVMEIEVLEFLAEERERQEEAARKSGR